MNVCLNGGLAPQATITKPQLLSSGMLTSRTPQPQPLTLSIPPPLTLSNAHPHANPNATATATVPTHNPSSLIAQQQAQYIAQQNLLARQQAAAAQQFQAAALQADPMFFQNLGYLTNPLMHQPTSTMTAAAAAAANNPYGQIGQIPMGQPQFFYIPRPMFPMGFPGLAQFSAAAPAQSNIPTSPPNPQQITTGQNPIVPVSSATAYVTPSQMKRTYENAFRNDQIVGQQAAKRAFSSAPATNIFQYPYPQL